MSTFWAFFTCEADTTQRDEDKRTHLCREREARQKAEVQVQELDRLLTDSLKQNEKFRGWAEATLRRAVEIAVNLSYDYADTEYDEELDLLKATLNQNNK